MKFLAAGALGAVLGASLLGLAGCSRADGDGSQNAPLSSDGYTTVTVPLPNGEGSVLCVTTYSDTVLSCDFSTRHHSG